LNRYEQLKYIFDLDLDGSYSELQYKDFLSNYRNAYREVYAMFDGVKAENEVLKRQLVKKDQEILSHQEANKQLAKDVMSLRKKINTKLSFSERLFGKIKF
jgi:hypothetical protein